MFYWSGETFMGTFKNALRATDPATGKVAWQHDYLEPLGIHARYSSVLTTAGGLLFAWAYARAEASYLSVTEYSAFLWASALGWLIFHEKVSFYTIAGAALIVGGCLIAARGKAAAPPEMDYT